MPTIIGVVFFLLALLCFMFREEDLFGLLILATVFEAASAINFADRGIQSYYVVALFIIARATVNRTMGRLNFPNVPHGGLLLAFGSICIVSAIFFPRFFAGMPIYDPQIGIDDGLLIHPALVPKFSNLVQPAYLTVHIATVFSLPALRFSFHRTGRALLWAFYLETMFLIAESICQFIGVSFPLDLFLNNPGYSLWTEAAEGLGIRNPGTFAEPSLVGAFMLIFSVSFLAQYFAGRGSAFKPLLSLLAVGLAASSSSLLLVALISLVLLIRFSPIRFPLRINLDQLRRAAWIFIPVVLVAVVLLLLFSTFQNALVDLTVGKGETSSFVNRTASDLFALQLFVQTMGVGVGLGSNRASSLITTLLSNVGIAGTATFFMFYCKLYLRLPPPFTWLKWAGLTLLLNMCLGLADVTMPLLWIPILLAVQLTIHGKQKEFLPPYVFTILNSSLLRVPIM